MIKVIYDCVNVTIRIPYAQVYQLSYSSNRKMRTTNINVIAREIDKMAAPNPVEINGCNIYRITSIFRHATVFTFLLIFCPKIRA